MIEASSPARGLGVGAAAAAVASAGDLGRAFLVPAGPNRAHVVFFGLLAPRARRAGIGT